jgi:hypothetical protein
MASSFLRDADEPGTRKQYHIGSCGSVPRTLHMMERSGGRKFCPFVETFDVD